MITTIGIDFREKEIEVNNVNYIAQIWDTAGQERFRCITASYYREAKGAVFVFDLTDLSSFNGIKNWLNSVCVYNRLQVKRILVGNKVDLSTERVVSMDIINKLVDSIQN